MKFTLVITCILFIIASTFAQSNDEFRAVWVITWEHISSSSSPEQNKERVRTILDNVKKANMNAVLWQARQGGTAYYNSSYEPWGSYAGGSDPGYDPLAYAIEEGHKRGIEVHAWFNVFAASSTVAGSPAGDNPEWVCRDQDGYPMTSSRALSPGLDTVRAYTINVAMEIVRNYDIDGLHLDYVRWNEYSNSKESKEYAKEVEQGQYLDGMISDEQILDLEQNKAGRYLYDIEHPYSAGVPTGFSTWEEWWRWSVTEFVKVLHDSVQSVKPWVRLSPAALGKYNWSGWQGYGSVYQDAALWFNQGYIDQLTPMSYHWTTPSGFYNMLIGGCPECWGQYIQQGVNDGRLFSVGPGSYRFGSDWHNHPAVIEKCREVSFVDGFQFFSYGSWKDRQYWEEAGDTFFGSKTKIRDTGLFSSEIPGPPTIASINKLDSLNYTITVVPNASITENNWFAVYRSESGNVHVDSSEIVDIHFGKIPYTILQKFDGNQNFNGIYTYGATTLNRYWNESSLSNLVSTDVIPSFPPTVVETIPANGDTITVNSDVVVYFSKEMDIATVNSAISFYPQQNIAQISWSNTWPDENKKLTIKPEGSFQFDTDYRLKIDSTALGLNGKPLDGDGDGSSGDSFILNFRTKDVDDVGPIITYTYPDYQIYMDSFDVRDVITVVFDELINHGSIEDSNLVWKKDDAVLNTQFLITDMNDRSIVSVGSYDTLISNSQYSFFLENSVTDTIGNPMLASLNYNFRTADEHYVDETLIENFSNSGGTWQQPDYSGSTVGIIVPQTSFGYSTGLYLPASATAPINRKSAYIRYSWDTNASSHLLREYLSGGAPRNISFDTTYVLQVYVFGDGSNNKFRFALDEGDGSNWPNHEVSNWKIIDWYGWQLIEWDLGDPNTVGEWIGNGILDMSSYRIDSFQMTYDHSNGAVSGRIYLDNLRIVKKAIDYTGFEEKNENLPNHITLYQNYPNPFNPVTNIRFYIPQAGHTSLKVYDILGRLTAKLVDENLSAGEYNMEFNAGEIASGSYFYILESNGQRFIRKMIVMK